MLAVLALLSPPPRASLSQHVCKLLLEVIGEDGRRGRLFILTRACAALRGRILRVFRVLGGSFRIGIPPRRGSGRHRMIQ